MIFLSSLACFFLGVLLCRISGRFSFRANRREEVDPGEIIAAMTHLHDRLQTISKTSSDPQIREIAADAVSRAAQTLSKTEPPNR